jgi:hypothetical protein
MVAHRLEQDPEALDNVVSRKSKLTKPIRSPKAWAEPAFVAEIEYRDITAEGAAGQLVQGPVESMNPKCPICRGLHRKASEAKGNITSNGRRCRLFLLGSKDWPATGSAAPFGSCGFRAAKKDL